MTETENTSQPPEETETGGNWEIEDQFEEFEGWDPLQKYPENRTHFLIWGVSVSKVLETQNIFAEMWSLW